MKEITSEIKENEEEEEEEEQTKQDISIWKNLVSFGNDDRVEIFWHGQVHLGSIVGDNAVGAENGWEVELDETFEIITVPTINIRLASIEELEM
jgi:hypothetical protein